MANQLAVNKECTSPVGLDDFFVGTVEGRSVIQKQLPSLLDMNFYHPLAAFALPAQIKLLAVDKQGRVVRFPIGAIAVLPHERLSKLWGRETEDSMVLNRFRTPGELNLGRANKVKLTK